MIAITNVPHSTSPTPVFPCSQNWKCLQSLSGLNWKTNKLQCFWIPWSACNPLSMHPSRNGPNREQLRASFVQEGCCKIKLCQGWQLRAQHQGKRVKDTPHSVKVCAEPPPGSEILLLKTTHKIWLAFVALKALSSEEKIPVHIADLIIHHSGPFLYIVVRLLEDTKGLEILEVTSTLLKKYANLYFHSILLILTEMERISTQIMPNDACFMFLRSEPLTSLETTSLDERTGLVQSVTCNRVQSHQGFFWLAFLSLRKPTGERHLCLLFSPSLVSVNVISVN